jgi:HD-GYP domain-containing protein (c-di-GMP phosphodiesterase class II)
VRRRRHHGTKIRVAPFLGPTSGDDVRRAAGAAKLGIVVRDSFFPRTLSEIYAEPADAATTQERLRRATLLHRTGLALSSERNRDRLLETILVEAQGVCHADGGTLYLRNDRDELCFAILRNDSLGLRLGGTTGKAVDLPPIPTIDPIDGQPNHANVASFASHVKQSVNIRDAYDAPGFDFSGTRAFDEHHGYRSRSFLTIPLQNSEGFVLGVLQLINARRSATNDVVPFRHEDQLIVEAFASQAGIAIDNRNLLDGQRELLESFIMMIAGAIDAKSPYTGSHCERVPVLTEMLTRSLCEATSGPFAGFSLTEEEWYELRIAAWLHDCGKVVTPTHLMDKATKLERVYDRVQAVRTRFEVLVRDARIAFLEAAAGRPAQERALLEEAHEAHLAELGAELGLIERSNIGGEFLSPDEQAKLRSIGARTYDERGRRVPLLSPEELENLCISRGTLTHEERIVINGHMVQTVRMLEALPFPRHLRRVPEYAGGHHERMDGKGYPKGLFAGDMSIPARVLAIADVFEALTATDRPYKQGKKLSETMRIMANMKRDNHLDPELLDHFVKSGVYRAYAERYLSRDLIDTVDEAAVLAIEPKPFELLPEAERQARFLDFLPEYRTTGQRRISGLPDR